MKKHGRKKPDLFLLDMYFPEERIKNTERELKELDEIHQKLLKTQAEYGSVLAKLRQSSSGGLKLANELSKHGHYKFVFFTRKGRTIDDAIAAIEAGAVMVIKKPDPNELEINGRSHNEAYDIAFEKNAPQIQRDIDSAIIRSSWWSQNKKTVVGGFVAGFISSLIGKTVLEILAPFFM